MKKIALLDHCTADYFSGYHLPVIAIPVYDSMLNSDVAEEIKEEYDSCFELFDGYIDEGLVDDYIKELNENPNDIFVLQDEIDYDVEPSYLYFSVINPKYSNGIMFLS